MVVHVYVPVVVMYQVPWYVCIQGCTVVLEMSNTGNKVPNTGNAHYLPVLEYRGYTAIKTAVGAFPGKN